MCSDTTNTTDAQHQHIHHHHHQHQHEGSAKTLGEKNKDHFNDQVAEGAHMLPIWQAMGRQIMEELRSNAEWMGLSEKETTSKDGVSSDPEAAKSMLDYACGSGVCSIGLSEYFNTIRGMDISSGMVTAYNKRAQEEGFSPTAISAIEGDIINPTGSEREDVAGRFDLAAISTALHHVEDPEEMIHRLAQTLRPNGQVLVIDWIQDDAFERHIRASKMSAVHTISRQGFTKEDLDGYFKAAGLVNSRWRPFVEKCELPKEIAGDGETRLFLAVAQKPSDNE